MRRSLVVVLALVAGCGSGGAVGQSVVAGVPTTTMVAITTTSSIATATSSTVTAPATTTKPHFDTPEAAMEYLAAAWNARDTVALRHVTNPSARAELDAMHDVAVHLRLDHCDKNPVGDYTCHFRHDFPASTSTSVPGETGEAVFLAGPADTPGWYMTVFESCS